uniref:Uncharacterized protein n=1 Tax=Labrus bergylta TaxID=56723 RepID=A0A3Q3EQI8_9LABR
MCDLDKVESESHFILHCTTFDDLRELLERRVEEPQGSGPFFFMGGTNGAGWKMIHNKHRKDFKLKWCDTKSSAKYSNFREGEQLMYHIPNNKVLTTKIGLLSSLREYERVSSKVNHGRRSKRLVYSHYLLHGQERREGGFLCPAGACKQQQELNVDL